MAEYTWKNLIYNPTLEEAKNAIGKECYFGSTPIGCIKNANDDKNSSVLREVRSNEFLPFITSNYGSYSCIIVKEEPKHEYAPFKSMEEFVEGYVEAKGGVKSNSFEDKLLQCGMWVKVKGISSGGYCTVNELWNDGVALGHSKIYNVQNASGEFSTVIETVSWEDLYKGFTFLDGSPCGKLVEIK